MSKDTLEESEMEPKAAPDRRLLALACETRFRSRLSVACSVAAGFVSQFASAPALYSRSRKNTAAGAAAANTRAGCFQLQVAIWSNSMLHARFA